VQNLEDQISALTHDLSSCKKSKKDVRKAIKNLHDKRDAIVALINELERRFPNFTTDDFSEVDLSEDISDKVSEFERLRDTVETKGKQVNKRAGSVLDDYEKRHQKLTDK
jgi:cell division protein FtsB